MIENIHCLPAAGSYVSSPVPRERGNHLGGMFTSLIFKRPFLSHTDVFEVQQQKTCQTTWSGGLFCMHYYKSSDLLYIHTIAHLQLLHIKMPQINSADLCAMT